MTCVLRMVYTGGRQGFADLCNKTLACQGLTDLKAGERAFAPSADGKVSHRSDDRAQVIVSEADV